jgi:hypothetical protein
VLTCGDKPVPDKRIAFALEGPGRIDGEEGTTDAAGTTRVTYTADGDQGVAIVTGTHVSCATCGNPLTAIDAAHLYVNAWKATLVLRVRQDPADSYWTRYANDVHMEFALARHEDGRVTGTGTGSQRISVSPAEHCAVAGTDGPEFDVTAMGNGSRTRWNLRVLAGAQLDPGALEALSFGGPYGDPGPGGAFPEGATPFAVPAMVPSSFRMRCEYDEEHPEHIDAPEFGLLIFGYILGQLAIEVRMSGDHGTGRGSGAITEELAETPIRYDWEILVERGGAR